MTGDAQGPDGPFALDAMRVDPAAGEVTGPAGREQLDPKVMDVLRVLHANRGALVPRETLFDAVWGERIVTDDVLSRCIYQLRRQLSAAGGADAANLIETLPKRGYRLRAASRIEPDPAPPRLPQIDAPQPVAPAPRRSRVVALALVVLAFGTALAVVALRPRREPDATPLATAAPPAPAPANTVAVLPFADMSERRDQAYLAEGLAEELLATLAERSGLAVTARTSSFAMADRPRDAVEIGRTLGVAYLVEGSVRKSGGRLRITTDLIDARDGRRLWTRKYDRSLGDVFVLQDEVAGEVARSLQATLAARSAAGRPHVGEANDEYLHGRFLFNRRGPGDLDLAEQRLQRAVSLDPAHGPAWAALAGLYGADPVRDPGMSRRREAVERALALDPDHAEVQVRAMSYYFAIGDRESAARHRARAGEIDPDNPLLLGAAAGFAHWQGRRDAAVALQRRVIVRDPYSSIAHNNLANYLMAAGDYRAAREAFNKVLELNPSDFPRVRAELVRIAILEGHTDAAWTDALALPAGAERDFAIAMLGPARGEHALAAEALARRVAAETSPFDAVGVAEVHAYLGEHERAWEILARLVGATGRVDREDWDWHGRLRESPFFAPIRSDPRWRALEAGPADR